MKPEEKWNNHVIEVLNKEHGKKVIEWWREQGVYVEDYSGCNTKEEGDEYIYYGIINEGFSNYNIRKVNINNAKTITLPEPFPEKWYMVCDELNREMANEWLRSKCVGVSDIMIGNAYCSEREQHYYFGYGGLAKVRVPLSHPDYTEISFEQFKEHVLKQPKQSNKMKITSEQAQQIIGMVSPSCKWKERLLDLWAKNIVLKQEIDVDDSLYKEGYKDASAEQKKVLDGIFGKGNEVKVPDINLGGFLCDRGCGEYKGIAFYLNDSYNWEIKKDSYDCLCLIPTNK